MNWRAKLRKYHLPPRHRIQGLNEPRCLHDWGRRGRDLASGMSEGDVCRIGGAEEELLRPRTVRLVKLVVRLGRIEIRRRGSRSLAGWIR